VVYGDSRVVIDDLLGPDGASAPSLRAFRREALRLAALIGVRFSWIPRHRNQRADRLAQLGHR
jgi:ribonuclease HI